MKSKKSLVFYIAIVFLLNVTLISVFIFNIVNRKDDVNFMGFLIFSIAFWIVGLFTIIFRNEKLFDWLYRVLSSLGNKATPEFFASSHYVAPRNKMYKALICSTYGTLGIALIFQIVVMVMVITT